MYMYMYIYKTWHSQGKRMLFKWITAYLFIFVTGWSFLTLSPVEAIGLKKLEEKVSWLSEYREHLYSLMPPAHFILLKQEMWDKTLWGPTATLRMSFSHTEPLSQNSLHKSPKSQPQVFEEASQTSHNLCFVHRDSELPLGLCFLITQCLNRLRLITAMNTFSVYSMRHLAGSMTSIHSVALWEHFPWILPIFTLRENPCSRCLPNRKVI